MSSTRKDLLSALMRERKTAYTQVFGLTTNSSTLVLADLKRFCRDRQSTFHPDPQWHALLEGRREVVLRVLDFLELSIEDLVIKYGGSDASPTMLVPAS